MSIEAARRELNEMKRLYPNSEWVIIRIGYNLDIEKKEVAARHRFEIIE